ncbi:MAG: radical SAM protein [Candidatus Moraniibacteriota bacterium]
MSIERTFFEKKGLVLDKERVLTYSKLSCPLDCRYCFVDDLSTHEQQRGVSYLSPEQLELLHNLPKEISLVMLGCDTEFFQNRKDALNILHEITELKKDVSVITKLALPTRFIGELKIIADTLERQGNIFSLSISLPCYASSELWEPVAPAPERRIEVLRQAYLQGINTLVALRPLLPTLPNEELWHIIEETKGSTIGYYSGPLYLKELDQDLIPENIRGGLNIETLQPHWMPEGNLFYKIERPGQMEFLQKIILEKNKLMFDGSADANEFLRSHEEYRNKSPRA